jgi:hypothetical protein
VLNKVGREFFCRFTLRWRNIGTVNNGCGNGILVTVRGGRGREKEGGTQGNHGSKETSKEGKEER